MPYLPYRCFIVRLSKHFIWQFIFLLLSVKSIFELVWLFWKQWLDNDDGNISYPIPWWDEIGFDMSMSSVRECWLCCNSQSICLIHGWWLLSDFWGLILQQAFCFILFWITCPTQSQRKTLMTNISLSFASFIPLWNIHRKHL